MKERCAGFVLNYSAGDYSEFLNLLVEISWAIYTISKHALKWYINRNKIAIAGFSAEASIASMSYTIYI